MKTINTPKQFTYLPAYRYSGDRSTFIGSAKAGLVELIMNSFGKTKVYEIEKNGGTSHLEGRGDTHHRTGGVISFDQHDELVAQQETHRGIYKSRVKTKA